MRCDFKDRTRDSVYVGGYFKVKGPDSEEVSAKLNGGPHTSSSPENTYADTMDIGIVNFLGTRSRVRWEKTHPNYSSGIPPTSHQLPVGDIRNNWRGFIGMKVNLDTDCDGNPDKVAIVGMVDTGGLRFYYWRASESVEDHFQTYLFSIRDRFEKHIHLICRYYW